MSHKRITAQELMQQKDSKLCILDVRTNAEVKSESLPGCLHIPLHQLTPEELKSMLKTSDKDVSKVYLLCQGGKRAELAAMQLQGNVDAELYIIEGGLNAVKAAKIPVQASGRKTIALERQVRIAAGFLVVSGVLLGAFTNPAFYGLSGLVGAGLMYAGITDTCLMGMVLARMPWNR